jgi:replication factor A1
MEVKDLQPRQGKVDITIEVSEKGDIREFEKFGKKGRVCSAKGKDTSGEIILSLWNEQIEQVNVGDKIQITNGYVSEFQGEKQLTTGKFGKLEVVEKGEGKEEQPTVFTNAPPEELKKEMEELSGDKLDEKPVDDEEYIG